jgi:hypothetical protein
MRTSDTQSLEIKIFEQAKDKQFKAQLQRVYHALNERPMTMKETDVYTGVMRENICRYIDTLFEQGKIAILRKRKCTITGYPYVNEYTTNPEFFPKSNQLKMF